MNSPQMLAPWSLQFASRRVETTAVLRTMALIMASVFLYAAIVLLLRDASQLASLVSIKQRQTRSFQPGDRVRVVVEFAPLKIGDQTLALVRQGTLMKVIEAVDGWVGGRVSTAGKTRAGWIAVDQIVFVPPEKIQQVSQPDKGHATAAGKGGRNRAVARYQAPSSGTPSGTSVTRAAVPLASMAKSTTTSGANTDITASPEQPSKPAIVPPSTAPPAAAASGTTHEAASTTTGAQEDARKDSLGSIPPTSRNPIGNGKPATDANKAVTADTSGATSRQTKPTAKAPARNPSTPAAQIADIQLLFVHTIDQIESLDRTKSIGQLSLAGDQFSDRSLRDIDGLTIQKLSIEATSLTNNCMKYISHIRGLRLLRLWSPRFTDGVLPYLRQFKNLEILDLDPSGVVGEKFEQLAGLTKLHMLVAGPRTTDAALEKLAALPALTQLDLRACDGLTANSFAILGKLKKLEQLWLPASIARKGRSVLRKQLPQCRIQ